eukprot:1250624-Prymnesium_polylepis.1
MAIQVRGPPTAHERRPRQGPRLAVARHIIPSDTALAGDGAAARGGHRGDRVQPAGLRRAGQPRAQRRAGASGRQLTSGGARAKVVCHRTHACRRA